MKGVNARSLPIECVARGAFTQIGQWKGKTDITVTHLDDKKFYLGINFLDAVKAFLEPYTDTMCINEGKMLSVLQVS